jgi:hypothetical protein
MNAALYGTIWIALGLFCAGEAGRRHIHAGRLTAPWAWWAFSVGGLLCAIHVAIAMSVTYGWNHDAAVAATARQTMAVYGLDWGGGVYVNYAFVGVWWLDAWRWRRCPSRDGRVARVVTWTTRIFFFVIILNAAVIFAGGTRRIAGALIVLWLLWIWRPVAGREPALTSSASD